MKSIVYPLTAASFAYCYSQTQTPLKTYEEANIYSTGGPFTPQFDKRVQELLDHFHVPGVSISVVHGNDTFATGYGYAILPDEKATPETLYYCASTTKSFTAASVLKLIEDSANTSKPLTLRSKLQSLMPDEFVLQDSYATNHITLEDALSHRTGMPRHEGSYGWANATLEGVVRNLRNLPITGELREEWLYCNMMYMTLSYVIEKLSGQWLGDFFREHIWAPLQMDSTYFSLSDAQRTGKHGGPKLAVGYAWNNETRGYVSTPYIDSPIVSGAGNTISNVLDYAKYLRAMLIMDEAILSKQSYHELRTPRAITGSNDGIPMPPIWTGPKMYSLGWEMGVYHDNKVFLHGGGTRGFAMQMAYIPSFANGVGLSIMANGDTMSSFVVQVLTMELMDEMMGVPEEDRIDIVSDLDAGLQHLIDELQPEMQRKRVFPDAPAPDAALPLPLPLSSYVGEYWNDGYQNLSVTLEDVESSTLEWIKAERVLHVDARDRLWQHTITFEHVSGNFFIAWTKGASGVPTDISARPAEFIIGIDGQVRALGLKCEPTMGKELVWYHRRSSGENH